MTRQEFIQTLRHELRKLPPEEIVAATEFYEEYFDDALESLNTDGMTEEEAEQLRIRTEEDRAAELGNPKAIAAQIKSDYAARILEGETTAGGEKVTAKHKLSAIWWVIIGICSAPVSIPLAIAIAGAAIAAITTIISGILGIYCGIIAGAIGGIAFLVAGCAALGTAASTGVMLLGFGLLALSVSTAAGAGAFIGTRELIRATARLARHLSEKRRHRRIEKMRGGAGYERA